MEPGNTKRIKAKRTTIRDLLASEDVRALGNSIVSNMVNTEILIVVSVDRANKIKAEYAGCEIGPFTVCGLLDYAKLKFLTEDEPDG